MAGFDVDPVALRSAVNKLKDQREELDSLLAAAQQGITAGELTAGDNVTSQAREKIEQLASGGPGSMGDAVRVLRDQLNQKIESYEATLQQYATDDDAASADAQRIERAS